MNNTYLVGHRHTSQTPRWYAVFSQGDSGDSLLRRQRSACQESISIISRPNIKYGRRGNTYTQCPCHPERVTRVGYFIRSAIESCPMEILTRPLWERRYIRECRYFFIYRCLHVSDCHFFGITFAFFRLFKVYRLSPCQPAYQVFEIRCCRGEKRHTTDTRSRDAPKEWKRREGTVCQTSWNKM